MYHFALNPSRATIANEIPIINTNKNLESLLISRSNLPTFILASFEFISDLVSLPVYTT